MYDDDDTLMNGAKHLVKEGVKVSDVYSPMPLHGIDPIIGVEPTRLGIAAFLYGLTGTMLAIIGIRYMMIIDWPMNIGGKPNFSLHENMLSFVPIFFEFTVLCAAHGMAITYLLRNKTLPGMPARNPDPRTTDDKFIIEIKSSENAHIEDKKLSDLIKSTGFIEIEEKNINMSNRILKSQYTLLLILVTAMFFQSCVKHPDSPGYEYSDDMTRSQAIEAYVDYGLVADNVNDSLKQTISARIPAEGSIPYSENKNTASLNMPFNYAAGEDERIRAGQEVVLPTYYYNNDDIAKANIAEGKRLYGLFCAHCHGDKGNGDGKVITVGGYPAAPPAYNTLQDRTPGSVFHTITHGKNAMGPHSSQLNKDERWKVAMYVRTMQFDGDLNMEELTADNATIE